MNCCIESHLQTYGVTNLIDVDGLLYAPVSDLWRFYQDVTIDHLADAAIVVASGVVIGWSIFVIADFVVGLIQRKKAEN